MSFDISFVYFLRHFDIVIYLFNYSWGVDAYIYIYIKQKGKLIPITNV